jgi:hypothetical protein
VHESFLLEVLETSANQTGDVEKSVASASYTDNVLLHCPWQPKE